MNGPADPDAPTASTAPANLDPPDKTNVNTNVQSNDGDTAIKLNDRQGPVNGPADVDPQNETTSRRYPTRNREGTNAQVFDKATFFGQSQKKKPATAKMAAGNAEMDISTGDKAEPARFDNTSVFSLLTGPNGDKYRVDEAAPGRKDLFRTSYLIPEKSDVMPVVRTYISKYYCHCLQNSVVGQNQQAGAGVLCARGKGKRGDLAEANARYPDTHYKGKSAHMLWRH